MEIIGYLALGIGLLGYVWTDPRDVQKIGLPAGLLWIVYFVLLGSWTAVATATLSFLRQIATIWFSDRALRIGSLGLLALLAAIAVATTPGWLALLPIAVASWKTLSAWLRDFPIAFRMSNIGAEATFLVFAALMGAEALMVSASIAITVNAVTAALISRRGYAAGIRPV